MIDLTAALRGGAWDHEQVPWFQCIAHECRYHFRSKNDNDHWPTRPVKKDGQLAPVPWTFDAGHGPDELLWTIERVDKEERSEVQARPKRAWPTACQRYGSMRACGEKHCIKHMAAKLEDVHQERPRPWATTRRRRGHNHRMATEESAWLGASRAWLHEFQAPDAEGLGSERDAFTIHQELGNGSGPSEGPVDL